MRIALAACLFVTVGAAADSLRIEGIDEQRFNALSTEFSATLDRARLSEDDDDVTVLINGEAIAPTSTIIRDRTIRIDATF